MVANRPEDHPSYKDVLENCYSVIFFGVPNSGIRFEELITVVKGKRSHNFVSGLLSDEDTDAPEILSALSRSFGNIVDRFPDKGLDILCYYETKKTQTIRVSFSHIFF